MNKKLIVSTSLLSSCSMYANGGFLPTWIILYRIHASMSFFVFVSICMLIEFGLLCLLIPQGNRLKIAWATIAMNIASTIVGFFYMSIMDLGIIGIMTAIDSFKMIPNPIFLIFYVFWFVVQSACINGLVEALIARLFFKNITFKRLFLYIALVNAATAVITLVFPFIYEYFFGPIRI